MLEVCRSVLERVREYRKRKERPVPAAHPQPLPSVLHPALLCLRSGPSVYRARRASFPAPCLALPGRLARGIPQEPDLPLRVLELRLQPGASNCPAKTSRRLPLGGRPQSCPSQPTRSSPAGQPSRAGSSCTHRRAALGSPASGQPGPVGGSRGVEAGPPGARGALRGRADAQARSRPRSRTDSPSAHPHAHAGGARRAGSAADASAEARGIPGMRHRPPSAGHCRAPPGPPDHAPGHAPPTSRWAAKAR